MTDAEGVLRAAKSALVVDWPSRDVPDTLARAGYTVIVKGGPEPHQYSVHEVRDGALTLRELGRAPEHVDLLYSHRPLEELPGLVAMAKAIGATTVWCQSGLASAGVKDPTGCWVTDDESREARGLVESAGLAYVDGVYIADAVRGLARSHRLPLRS